MVVCRDDNETGFLGYLIVLPFKGRLWEGIISVGAGLGFALTRFRLRAGVYSACLDYNFTKSFFMF